jgi:hypothetical protein
MPQLPPYVAMSRPKTLICWAMELASSGYVVADDIATMLAHRGGTGKRRVHCMRTLMIKGTLPLRCCIFLDRSLVQLQAHARLIRQGQAAMPGDRRLDVDHLIDAFP